MTTYHVDQTSGKDSNSGLSADQAFKNLARGLQALMRGDTLLVGPGVYPYQTIDTPGVTIRGNGAVIDGQSEAPWGLLITAPHVVVEGLEVRRSKRAGIHIRHTHHVTIQGCKVHHNLGTGIFATRSDYLTLDDNDVFLNCKDTSHPSTSAISIFQPTEAPGGPRWFRLRVTRNRIYDNSQPGGTDGFAFILDNNPPVPYPHRLLVEGNYFYDNARGMLFFNCGRFVCRHNHGCRNGPVEFRFRHSRGLVQDNIASPSATGIAYHAVGWTPGVLFQDNLPV